MLVDSTHYTGQTLQWSPNITTTLLVRFRLMQNDYPYNILAHFSPVLPKQREAPDSIPSYIYILKYSQRKNLLTLIFLALEVPIEGKSVLWTLKQSGGKL